VAEKEFHVSLPQEVVGGFGWNESEVPSRVREALVMDLLRLGRLSLLREVTGSLLIPDAVYDEIVVKQGGMPGAAAEFVLRADGSFCMRDICNTASENP